MNMPNPNVQSVIRKWYDRLGFPRVYDREFEQALDTIPIPEDITIDTYDLNCPDGKRNLLSFLYMCDGVEEAYRKLGIGEDILVATLQDIVRWTVNWSDVKGELCLFELPWLTNHMKIKLFKVGRLQFCLTQAWEAIPSYGIREGDNVVELHIHHGGRLTPEEVDDSLARGRAFLATYFPGFQFPCFTCHSWLLDDKLKDYLPETSNIIRFGNRFHKVHRESNNALLRFLFRWDACEENISRMECRSDFQRAVKEAVLRGETFHEVTGVLPK